MNYFDKQIRDAKENYVYFFVKMIFSIFKEFFKLSLVLIISGIFDYTIVNIISLIFTIYSFYNVFDIYYYYNDIMCEIKNTVDSRIFLEVDFNRLKFNLFKGVVKYGK